MIEFVQAGQAGKTGLLFDMHRLRARVFKDTLKWDVDVNPDGLEVDQFDLPETVYLLAVNRKGRVVGNWRMLPTDGPTMIRDVWPEFMESLPLPSDPDVFEVSRFAVHSPEENTEEAMRENQQALGEMFCALTEVCIMTGIRQIYTLYDQRIAKVIQRIDCHPAEVSSQILIKDMLCQTGMFYTNEAMLERLRAATGIQQSLVDIGNLPPMLASRIQPIKKEKTNG